MSSYKLTYFNARGRAEVIRLIFAKAGVDYEDNRVVKEVWPSLKEGTPLGQLPVLEVDGTVLFQSIAISRFLAKRFGLYGNTEFEESQIDAICLSMEDFLKPLERFYHEQNVDAKTALKDKYEKDDLPRFMKCLKKLLGGKNVFVGNSITIADIYFAHYCTMPENCGIAIDWGSYPELKAVKENVENDDKIAAWLKSRPQTQH